MHVYMYLCMCVRLQNNMDNYSGALFCWQNTQGVWLSDLELECNECNSEKLSFVKPEQSKTVCHCVYVSVTVHVCVCVYVCELKRLLPGQSACLTLSQAKPIITVYMLCKKKKCCTLQENVVSKQLTLYDQETTDQYVVDYKVLTVYCR
ncbi:hypothetical protein EMCRGX_G005121 [Ephydatia muelleri]